MDPADLPPDLRWERPAWDLLSTLKTQWRRGGTSGARTGLDYRVAIDLAARRGWNVDLVLELLGAAENEILDWDGREREQSSQN